MELSTSKSDLRVHILAFTSIRVVMNTMIRMVYPFLPVFARGLGVDLTAMSLALTARSAAGAAGPFLASVADSRGRKAGMAFGLLFFIAGTALVVIWPVFPVFVVSLMLAMVGHLVYIPSVQAYLGDRVPYNRRGLALAVTELAWSISFIAGMPLVAFLIARYGWTSPFPILTGLGLLALFGLAWLLPADPVPDRSKTDLWKNLRSVILCRPALAGLAMAIAYSAGNEMVNVIFGVWLEDAFGVKIAALGAASAAIGLAEMTGEGLVGGLSDRLGKARSVTLGLVLNTLAVIALPFLGYNLTGAIAGLFLLYLVSEFTVVSSIPMMTEVFPPARATLMAAFIACLSLGRIFGDVLSPVLYRLGGQVPSLPAIWLLIAASVLCLLVALICLLRLTKEFKER